MIKIFNFLRKKTKLEKEDHKHNLISLGKFYTIDNTTYRNEFDKVNIFVRLFCIKCHNIFDKKLGYEQFPSELYSISNRKKEDFISKIKKEGIIKKYEMEEKTMKYMYNIKEGD